MKQRQGLVEGKLHLFRETHNIVERTLCFHFTILSLIHIDILLLHDPTQKINKK